MVDKIRQLCSFLIQKQVYLENSALEIINNDDKFFQNPGQNLENTYEGLHFSKIMSTQAETLLNNKHCLKLSFRNLSSF